LILAGPDALSFDGWREHQCAEHRCDGGDGLFA